MLRFALLFVLAAALGLARPLAADAAVSAPAAGHVGSPGEPCHEHAMPDHPVHCPACIGVAAPFAEYAVRLSPGGAPPPAVQREPALAFLLPPTPPPRA